MAPAILAERKLIPALYQRQRAGQLSDPTRIIGASRSQMTDDEYRTFAGNAIKEHVKPEEVDQAEVEIFLKRLCTMWRWTPSPTRAGMR
ncbi:hypothetical protein VXQ18_14730 [Brucella abortus]|nr:hypothetical protein [Brucella abortus]